MKKIFILALTLSLFCYCPTNVYSSNQIDKYGGQVVFATTSDPKTFNDFLAKETTSTSIINLIFEGLTTTNAFTAKVEPHLAQNWDVSSDGLTWTFHLRKDVKWNDGVPFSADDVVFTYNDLAYNKSIPSSVADILTIDGQRIEVKKIDQYTVQFILPVKFAPFLRALGQAILPKHKLKESVDNETFNFTWGIDTDPKEIVGTGAYKLTRYDPGQRLVFEKNPYYWKKTKDGEKLPFISKIIYLIVQNADVQLLKFLEGTTDVYGMRGMDYPLLKMEEDKSDYTIFDLGPDTGSQFIFFNQNPGLNEKTNQPFVDPIKLKWFQDIHFRQAVAHAVDKKRIIEIVKNGLGYPQYAAMGPGSGFFHNPDVKKYDYDLDAARKILSEAGYSDRDGDGYIEDKHGNMVEFSLYTNSGGTERIDMAGIIRRDLELLGMKVNFQALEFNTLVQKLNATFEWEMILLGLTGGIEPHFGKNVWSSNGQLHMWYPRQEKPATSWEKRIDEIFVEGVQELNEDKRRKYYDEFQMIVSENLPLIYTVLSAKLTAVRDKFENLNPSNLGGVFHNLEELYIKEEYR